MPDVFGYNKKVKGPGDIASASAVVVKLDNQKVSLAQSARVDYQRSVAPNYELGSEAVYLTAGHSGGNVNISRLIGETAALAPYKADPCKLVTISLAKGDTNCAKDIGVITAQGMCTSMNLEVQAGQFTVADSASFVISNLTVS